MGDARRGGRGMRTKRITTNSIYQLAPDPICTPRSDCLLQRAESLASAQIHTRRPSKHISPSTTPVVVVQHAGHNVASLNPNVAAFSWPSNCYIYQKYSAQSRCTTPEAAIVAIAPRASATKTCPARNGPRASRLHAPPLRE